MNRIVSLAFYIDPLASTLKGYYSAVIAGDSSGVESHYTYVKDMYISAHEELDKAVLVIKV